MKDEQNTKTKILSAARECFTEKGYAETTIRDIANRAGISTGTIYLHFKGKEELFHALEIPEVANIRPEYDRKRNEVIHAALILFGERGFNGVTMEDIANELNIAKTTLYQYCESKEDLFSMIVQASSFNLFTDSISSSTERFNISDTIKEIGRSFLKLAETPERAALLKSIIRDSSQFPDLSKLIYDQGIKPACNNIVRYIELHCENNNKPLKDATELYKFVLTYIGSLQFYVMMHDIVPGVNDFAGMEEYLDLSTKVFVNYLKVNDYI